MFGKKKKTDAQSIIYRCPVPGCSLTCADEISMSRHMNWAHPAIALDKLVEAPGPTAPYREVRVEKAI